MTQNIDLKKAIATRLALARKQAGLTQQFVADELDIHRPAVSEIEAGRRSVSADELTQLSDLYGVNISWLSCKDEQSPDPYQDQLQLAARELKKLKPDDMESVIKFLRSLKKDEA
jgi:transcriptional regulator with XRE-family HTH domain